VLVEEIHSVLKSIIKFELSDSVFVTTHRLKRDTIWNPDEKDSERERKGSDRRSLERPWPFTDLKDIVTGAKAHPTPQSRRQEPFPLIKRGQVI
jgi:hypothetical protein